jgi:hypothetical protein
VCFDGIRLASSALEGASFAVVKATYDPDNLFHINQNITPAN